MNHLKSKLPDLIRSYSGTIMHINEYARTHYSVTIRGYILWVLNFFPNLTFTGQNFCLGTGVPRLFAGFGTSSSSSASLAYSLDPLRMRLNYKMASTSFNKIKLAVGV